jgi:mono/diheme cytochrome c family protein
MRIMIYGAAMAVLAGAGLSASAQPPGNAKVGYEYVRRHCIECHAVDAGAASATPKAPSFQSIANTPGMTLMALNVWLHSVHKDMPQLMVDQDSIPDIAAYLATLKSKPKSKSSKPPKP